MKKIIFLFFLINMLIISEIQAATVQHQLEKGSVERDYLDQHEGWVKIKPSGITRISANTASLKVNVDINTRTINGSTLDTKEKAYGKSSCTLSRTPCSMVSFIDVTVNGKQLVFPNSVYCDLADLNEGKIFIERDNVVLIFSAGDASTGSFVKIDFNRNHITRKAIFADCICEDGLLSETRYFHRLGN